MSTENQQWSNISLPLEQAQADRSLEMKYVPDQFM